MLRLVLGLSALALASAAAAQPDHAARLNPWPRLERIRAPMTWINGADDFIDPADYGIAEDAARRLKTARYILIPATPDTLAGTE